MNQLEITFATFINNYDVDAFYRKNGPLFHRWLPNGRDDALEIELPDEKARIFLWFERRGYVDENGFIRFDHKKKEVDKAIIPRQALLEAGALFGCVVLEDVAVEEYECVIEDKTDDQGYISLGKRVVQTMVDPFLTRITKILRDTYGQYWIDIPSSFDSRKKSLGQHCDHRAMKWKTLSGKKGDFLPTKKTSAGIALTGSMSLNFNDYLDKTSWFNLGELLNTSYEPSIALEIASRANSLLDGGRIQHALVECITSLEIVIEEYVREKLFDNSTLVKKTQSFWELNLPAKVTLIAALASLDENDIECSIKAIKERNDFVHEGKIPGKESQDHIAGVLRIIKGLINAPEVKFPSANKGNALQNWDQ